MDGFVGFCRLPLSEGEYLFVQTTAAVLAHPTAPIMGASSADMTTAQPQKSAASMGASAPLAMPSLPTDAMAGGKEKKPPPPNVSLDLVAIDSRLNTFRCTTTVEDVRPEYIEVTKYFALLSDVLKSGIVEHATFTATALKADSNRGLLSVGVSAAPFRLEVKFVGKGRGGTGTGGGGGSRALIRAASFIFSPCEDHRGALTDVLCTLRSQNAQLQLSAEEVKHTAESVVEARRVAEEAVHARLMAEETLVKSFVAVLNEKKARIRSLVAEMNDLRSENAALRDQVALETELRQQGAVAQVLDDAQGGPALGAPFDVEAGEDSGREDGKGSVRDDFGNDGIDAAFMQRDGGSGSFFGTPVSLVDSVEPSPQRKKSHGKSTTPSSQKKRGRASYEDLLNLDAPADGSPSQE